VLVSGLEHDTIVQSFGIDSLVSIDILRGLLLLKGLFVIVLSLEGFDSIIESIRVMLVEMVVIVPSLASHE